jgi:uncharacterized protein YndB with AHSA1/START domain
MARTLRAVDARSFDAAPWRFVCTEVVRRPPERVFAAIAKDPAGWGEWFPAFDRSGRWTTPGPPGPGSRRTMRMAGVTYEETILEWEEPTLFSFRVDRASLPLARAFAERYRVASHEAGSVVQWVVVLEPGLALRPLARFGRGVLAPIFARAMRNLEEYLG